jgi:hypothetical protein
VSLDFETPPPHNTLSDEQRRAAKHQLLEAIAESSLGRSPTKSKHAWGGRRAYAAVLVGVATAFFLAGAFAFAASGSGPAPDVSSPGFAPASGWNEVTTGAVPMDQGPTAIAANVPLASGDTPIGTFPTQTLSSLPENGIVFYVVIGSRGELSGVDAKYISSDLPLQLSNARVLTSWEGMPSPNIPEYQITAAVDNYNLSVDVFFGTQQPSDQQLAAAQEELNQLEVPPSS